MTPLFKKLNFKAQQSIFILNAPDSFSVEMHEMSHHTQVKTSITGEKNISFILAFVTRLDEVNALAKKVEKVLAPDALLWFAYPKGTSKRYKCEFNRDNGWNELGKAGFEGVRMIAIDEDWSALRFRKAENIKTMSRSFAMSDTGKKKVQASKNK